MERREIIGLAVAAPVIVFLSSYLGLGGRFFYVAPVDAYHLMVGIWRQSALADAVFVLGTLLAAAAGYRIARRGAGVPAFLVGALAHWLTYWASFMMLPVPDDDLAAVDPANALYLVATWGFVGLAVASAVPVALARLLAHADGADTSDADDAARA